MRSLRRIPQQYMSVLCPGLVVPDDTEVGDRSHYVRVRLGVVHGCCAARESRGRVEMGVWVTEVGDGAGAGVVSRGVGD